MTKFWNWSDGGEGERELRIDGTIASESWWDDEITPAQFRNELINGKGHVTLWINSPGGDVVAASQIYTMLRDYKDGVTVKIDGMAASAASVIAMAGTKVCMSPTAYLMIHNPLTVAYGNRDEMKKAMQLLDEIKEGIVNAYELKTGLPRNKIENMMDAETWMSAGKALELGFCDEVMHTDGDKVADVMNYAFSNKSDLLEKLMNSIKDSEPKKPEEVKVYAETRRRRLMLLK